MTVRKGVEAREAIEELDASFKAMRAEDLQAQDVIYGRHFQRLWDKMAEFGFPTKAPAVSSAIGHYVHDAEAELRVDMEFHVTTKRQWRGRGDAIETGAAWIWNKLNPGNRALRQIIAALITRPFAGVWETPVSFKPPAGSPAGEAVRKYMAGYFPITLDIDNGQQSSFLEQGGLVKLAARHSQIPFVSLARLYDKQPAKRRAPEAVLGEDYRDIVAGYGLGMAEPRTLLRSQAELWHLDDGEHICHYISLPKESGKDGEYRLIDGDDDKGWPNYVGRPMFHFASAFWNSAATDAKDRYRSFMRVVADERFNMDVLASVIFSAGASLPSRVLEADPVALLEALKQFDSAKEKREFMRSMMLQDIEGALVGMGRITQLDMPVPEAVQFIFNEYKEEYLRHLPIQAPSEMTVRNATGTALAQQVQLRNQRYLEPMESMAALIVDVCQDVLQIYRTKADSLVLNTPGASNQKGLYVTTMADERIKGKTTSAGTAYILDPELLGADANWYKLEVLPIDNSPSARTMRRLEARERRADETINEDERLELSGITNPEDFKRQRRLERWEAMYEDGRAALAYADAIQFQQAFYGSSAMEVMAAMQGGPVPNAAGEMVGPRGPSANGTKGPTTYQLQPPGEDKAQQAVT